LYTPAGDAKLYWLIPITENELSYKKAHGLEMLEEKFEEFGFNYADPYRDSVV
jgi:Suppressor of fused protein (SUFU)